MNITNPPEHVDLSDYTHAIDMYLDQIKNVPGIVSVNTMGSIRSPGLSDIDMIVVVEDDFNPKNSSKLSVRGLDSRIFIHGPFIIPHEIASGLQYIIYATNILNLYGEPCLPAFDSLIEEHKYVLSVCYVIDFLESRLLQYADVDFNQTINQRVWLTRLWSLIHTSYLLKYAGFSLTTAEKSLLANITATRSSWFEKGSIDSDLFIEAFHCGIELTKSIFKRLLSLIYGDHRSLLKKVPPILKGNKRIIFREDNNNPKYLSKHIKLGPYNIICYTCEQMDLYALHLHGYDFFYLPYSEKTDLNEHFSIMKQRRCAVLKHKRWLFRHAPAAGSLSGYLGLEPFMPSGLPAKIRRGLAKILFNF